jgi:hypothetical protein
MEAIRSVQEFEECDHPGLDGLSAARVLEPFSDLVGSLRRFRERDVPSTKNNVDFEGGSGSQCVNGEMQLY